MGGLNWSKIAFIFPGQGSQYVGMGKDIYDTSPAARRVFAEAEDVLGFGLRTLCFEGPEDVLTDTINAQPAILTVSIACLEAFKESCGRRGVLIEPSFVAGHSLGEYSALVAAGAIRFRDAVALVRERGKLMKEAGERQPGGMAAIMGLESDTLDRICQQASPDGLVIVANYNCPGQSVISGESSALERAIELAEKAGARRIVRLAITIASHSPLMRYASDGFAQAVNATAFEPATVPIVSNLQAKPICSVEEIRHELTAQLCNSVLWHQSVAYMITQEVGIFIEFGPGQVLSGLVKRVSKDVWTYAVNDTRSLETVLARSSSQD